MSNPSREYGEGYDPIPAIAEPTVVFMINRTYKLDVSTEEDIYQATRCSWVIGEKARGQAVYALGVAHGVVRGAYRIDGWTLKREDAGALRAAPHQNSTSWERATLA